MVQSMWTMLPNGSINIIIKVPQLQWFNQCGQCCHDSSTTTKIQSMWSIIPQQYQQQHNGSINVFNITIIEPNLFDENSTQVFFYN